MKVTFKKLFACLMALIMVMTVTPFTAVTASAAEAKSSNIAETEAKYKTAPSTTFTAKKGMSEVSWLNSSEVTTTEEKHISSLLLRHQMYFIGRALMWEQQLILTRAQTDLI